MADSFFSDLKTPAAPAAPAAEPAAGASFFSDLATPKTAEAAPQAPAQTAPSFFSDLKEPSMQPQAAEPPAGSFFSDLQTPDTNYTAKYAASGTTQGLSQDEREYGDRDPESMHEDNEPWYSKAWEWMNSPLYDLHKWGTREGAGVFERGIETGLEDIGSGLLSPLNLGLMVATFGGSTVETAGVTALKALGVTEELAPTVLKTGKLLMDAGFAKEMVGGLMQQAPEFLDAMKEGDTEKATRLATDLGIGTYFAAKALSHGFQDLKTVKDFVRKGQNAPTQEQLKNFAEAASNRDAKEKGGNDVARAKADAIYDGLKAAKMDDKLSQAAVQIGVSLGGDVEMAKKVRGILDETIRPQELTVEQQKAISEGANPNYVYAAVDKQYADQVRNAGLKNAKQKELQYYASPKDAVDGAVRPQSGDPKDLAVFAVPRAEVERAVQESRTAEAGPTAAGPRPLKGRVELQQGEVIKQDDGGELFYTHLHDMDNDSRIGSLETRVEPDGKTAHTNDSHVQPFARGRQFGKQLYIDAMRQAKERGVTTFENDYVGQTSPEAQRVWKSLIEKFDGKEEIYPGEGQKPRYIIDLTKVDPADLAQPTQRVMPLETADLVAKKTLMPAHELERDAQGNFTGESTALRPYGAEELPGDISRWESKYTPKEKKFILDAFDRFTGFNDDERGMITTLQQLYGESFDRMHSNGLIRQWMESYHPQAWAENRAGFWQTLFGKEPEKVVGTVLNQLRHDTDSGAFDTNVTQAKHRAFRTMVQGLMAGEKIKSFDVSKHVFDHINSTERAIANREFLQELRSKGLTAKDGRPAVVMAGSARVVGGEENPALIVKPKAVNKIHIDPEMIKAMRDYKNNGVSWLDQRISDGHITKLPYPIDVLDDPEGDPEGPTHKEPAYAYSTDGYVTLDHNATRGYTYAGQDTAGKPAFVYGDMKIHPDFAPEMRRILGIEESPLNKSRIGKAAGILSGQAKHLLLSFSPFHIVQEGLRAMMVGINPFKYDHISSQMVGGDPLLALGYKNGLKTDNFRYEDEFSTDYAGHQALVNKIPVIGGMQQHLQDFLFKKYIPGLKERAFRKFYTEMSEAHPDLTADEMASRAADLTNDTFGGQNWRKLGVSAAQQDFMKMTMLAPDWLISEVRMMGRALGYFDKETGAITRKMMAKQVAGIWITARVLNLLISGQMHNEAPFGVASKDDKGNEKVYSVRTLPTDMLHAISQPREFIAGRVNPLTVRPMMEGISGRDAMGRRVTWDKEAKDLIQNIVPIGAQGFFGKTAADLNSPDQVVKALGGAVYKYKTEAERMADQYASDRMPSGPVDPTNLARHQEDIRLEDAFRKGDISRGELRQAVSKRRADEIVRRAPMTPLQARFDRLPMNEKINVWEIATAAERSQLSAMLWKDSQRWMKEHNAAEREKDPVWRKLQNIRADIRDQM